MSESGVRRVKREFDWRWRMLLAVVLLVATSAQAEPLTLQSLLDETRRSHPLLGAARVEVQAAGEDVVAAKRQRLPSLTMSAEQGSNSYESSSSVQLQQTLWDGGRVSAGIDYALTSEEAAREQVREQWWGLAQQIIDAWQQLLNFAGRRDVARATIAKLDELQASMQRRVRTGASPEIELELVRARQLQTQTELQEAQVGLRTTLTALAQLSGVMALASLPIETLEPEQPGQQELRLAAAQYAQADWPALAAQSPSVVLAHYGVTLAEQRLQSKKAERWPEVYARLDQPLGGNGRNNGDRSTAVFIGVNYTPGKGFASLAETQAAATRVGGAEQGVDAALRDMRQTQAAQVEIFFGTRTRLAPLRASVDSSAAVLASYQRQFVAGRKSWLDVINAVRDLTQSQYAWQNATASVAGSLYQLNLLAGQFDKSL